MQIGSTPADWGAGLAVVSRLPPDLRGDAAVAWIAARQHGVIAGWQLRACGLSPAAIAHRVRRGRLHRVHRGVFAVGRPDVPAPGRVLAAILAAGPGTAASHLSSALLLGILPAGADRDVGLGPVDVTVADGRRARARPGVRCHETRLLGSRELRWCGPVPVTSAARTALDLAATDGVRTAERVLAEALRGRLATESEVRSLITRARGHQGVGVLAQVVDTGPAFDRSIAERLLLELLRRANLPEPEMNARVARWEVDALWPDLAVAVEFDSWTFHGDVIAFRKDRRKSAELQARGWAVVPVTWSDLNDAQEVVVATVSAVLATARSRRG